LNKWFYNRLEPKFNSLILVLYTARAKEKQAVSKTTNFGKEWQRVQYANLIRHVHPMFLVA